jgi:methionyl-tRNA formyltransferase
MSLRIIFMGTPDFAVVSLDKLWQNRCNIVAVVTVPDKPAGRGQQLQSPAVKKYAVEKGILVLQPEKLKDGSFIDRLKSYNPELIVVVAFRMLPENIWSMPKYGTLNLHASLLPQYRGAAPINWVIINGEKETGITTFFIEKGIDTGNIIFQEKIPINYNETAGQLHDKLKKTGANLLLKTVKAIEEGNYPKIPQYKFIKSASELRPAPKILKNNCRIQWNNSSIFVYNLIRGLCPYPAAWTEIKNNSGKQLLLKIFEAEIDNSETHETSGRIISDQKTFLKITTIDGALKILSLQIEGKKRLNTNEFLRGFQNIVTYKAVDFA